MTLEVLQPADFEGAESGKQTHISLLRGGVPPFVDTFIGALHTELSERYIEKVLVDSSAINWKSRDFNFFLTTHPPSGEDDEHGYLYHDICVSTMP